ncbi:MAG: tryptophan synthase subunit alpha [Deltaproteobacteria bacterium]|nr:tryptophan synthase subunit alpha [Deltaproteobacteria bacterium]
MSRISKTFKRLQREGRKALIPFITAGDPNLATTEKLVAVLEKAGADIIELGVPFSDPMADGPVIQKASERALKKGVTLQQILSLVKKVRKKSQIPILLMGYYNPVFIMGEENFASCAFVAGVDAVLIVDLPPEEAGGLRKALRKNKIDLIHLLAPTSDEGRIVKAAKNGSGFIYYVSLTGVTGAKLKVTASGAPAAEISDQLKRIRKHTKLPLAVGFGISTPEQARELAKIADGVVVGSALVKIIASKKGGSSLFPKVSRFVSSLRKVL